ncbi:MAG: hypothetical protein IH991_09320, partial [Planctomycetes bacterium]|nr:hypothetical protein [Planctomycetota bacterium]
MANVVATSHKIPAPVRSRLAALRRKILGWLLVDGLSRVVLLLVVVAAVDIGIVLLVRLVPTSMDFAQRLIMMILMVGALGAMFFWRLVRPLIDFGSGMGDDALCLEVEDAFDELGESLISSVQFSRMDVKSDDGISKAMVDATIDLGVRQAQAIQFGKTLNSRVFVINLCLMLAGLAAIGGVVYGASNSNNEFLWHWYQRHILLRDVPWPQKTYLEFEPVIDEYDKIVEIKRDDSGRVVEVKRDENGRVKTIKYER